MVRMVDRHVPVRLVGNVAARNAPEPSNAKTRHEALGNLGRWRRFRLAISRQCGSQGNSTSETATFGMDAKLSRACSPLRCE